MKKEAEYNGGHHGLYDTQKELDGEIRGHIGVNMQKLAEVVRQVFPLGIKKRYGVEESGPNAAHQYGKQAGLCRAESIEDILFYGETGDKHDTCGHGGVLSQI